MEFDVHVTDSLLKRIALKRIFRRLPLLLLAVALIGAGIWMRPAGHRSGTMSTIGLTLVAVLVFVKIILYFATVRRIADWKREQGDDPVHYSMDEENLRAKSNLGATELKWTVFRELLEHRDYFLLGMGRTGHLTLPRADLTPEIEAFIRKRFADLNLPTKKA